MIKKRIGGGYLLEKQLDQDLELIEELYNKTKVQFYMYATQNQFMKFALNHFFKEDKFKIY